MPKDTAPQVSEEVKAPAEPITVPAAEPSTKEVFAQRAADFAKKLGDDTRGEFLRLVQYAQDNL